MALLRLAHDGGQIWRMLSTGGQATQITRDGGDVPQESPDGKFIYYHKGWPQPLSVWRMPVEGGEEIKVLDSVHTSGLWNISEQGIYFFTAPDEKGRTDLRLSEFATGVTKKILTLDRSIWFAIAVSPDGRTVLYPQIDEAGSDLMMVESFE